MKFTWEESDILVGRRVIAHNDTEESIIGYDAVKDNNKKFILVSLRDGSLVAKNMSKEILADFLNQSRTKPLTVK